MANLVGIDIGTSSVKTIIMNEKGELVGAAQKGYEIISHGSGWAEQDARILWQAAKETTARAISESSVSPGDIAGIGFSGQMHSTVLLGHDNEPIAPTIIWTDRRSEKQCEKMREIVGKEKLAELAGNDIAPGFTAATLMWIKENEPGIFSQIKTVVLPKDFIRLKLTGRVATDVSDAAGTLLFDVMNRRWSGELIDLLDLPHEIFPPVYESAEIAGELTAAAARELGLKAGVPVAAGGGDQPIAAIGNGVTDEGMLLSTIGTGGQLFLPTDQFRVDPELRLHSFCHAVKEKWYLMGAILSAGMSLKWFRETFVPQASYAEIDAEAEKVPAGSEGVLFLPYLVGERGPRPARSGGFTGLNLNHTRAQLGRAVMEGVVMAMKRYLDIFSESGMAPRRIIASGGGARSGLWRQIQADVFEREILTTNTRQQAALGAAIVAGVAGGVFGSVGQACRKIIRTQTAAVPDSRNVRIYREIYERFLDARDRLREVI